MLHHLLAGATATVLSMTTAGDTGGPVEVQYERAGSARTAEARKLLQESGALRTKVRLPAKVTVVAKECGKPDASWDHERRRITLCYELVDRISTSLTGIAETEESVGNRHDARLDAALAVLFHHQLGHALADLNGLPDAAGEDLADRFAALTLTVEGGTPKAKAAARVVAAAEARHLLGSNARVDHFRGPAEAATFACHLYGAAPGPHARIATAGWLPADRAQGCQAEYTRLRSELGGYVSPR